MKTETYLERDEGSIARVVETATFDFEKRIKPSFGGLTNNLGACVLIAGLRANAEEFGDDQVFLSKSAASSLNLF